MVLHSDQKLVEKSRLLQRVHDEKTFFPNFISEATDGVGGSDDIEKRSMITLGHDSEIR
jgi:hypothetical protein